MKESKQKYNRISKHQIESIEIQLSERDKAVLLSVFTCRYLTTGQIKRLHYKTSTSDLAAMRAANRGVLKLKDMGLIVSLKRRIGGVRAGSGSYVWSVTAAGLKVLNIIKSVEKAEARKRIFEPSPSFLEHTLAVAEAYIQLNEIARCEAVELVNAELEPKCWRQYTSRSGALAYLKPDLYAVIGNEDYEDHYFFEIDKGTEAPTRIIKKCMQYVGYYNFKKEKRKSEVFPYVVWIVPDVKRKDSLTDYISQSVSLKNIFVIITMDKLKDLVLEGVEGVIKL